MYPVTTIFESYIYKGWAKTKKRQWTKNFTRCLTVIFTVIVTILLGEKTDKFLAILGSIACTPVAFIFPAAFHLKACAKTPKEKCIDISLVVFWLGLGIFCTVLNVLDWNN